MNAASSKTNAGALAELRKLRADLKTRRANATGAPAYVIDALDKNSRRSKAAPAGSGPEAAAAASRAWRR